MKKTLPPGSPAIDVAAFEKIQRGLTIIFR